MRKIVAASLAALTLAGGSLAAVAPAQAQPRYGWHGYGYGPGPVIFAGVAGLALGAALAPR